MDSPLISKDLLEYLQGVFPDKLPEAVTAPEQYAVLIGQQKVLRHLQAQHKLQFKRVLDSGIN